MSGTREEFRGRNGDRENRLGPLCATTLQSVLWLGLRQCAALPPAYEPCPGNPAGRRYNPPSVEEF